MKYKITAPKSVHSTIKLPASKSISNRALILNNLCNSPYKIQNLSDCDDTMVMIKAFEENSEVIDVMAAGTSMRFLTAYYSQIPGERIITGTERMKKRPIQILVNALNALGARISYVETPGYPPLKIQGSVLDGGEIFLSGAISSQFISAILMIAPTMEKGLVMHLEGGIISIPYIKLTLKMMSDFGVKADWKGNTITIYPQHYMPTPYIVESDWSGASYWYEIAALSDSAEIKLEGLFANSPQGDSKVAELFIDLGVETKYEEGSVVLTKTNRRTKKFFHNFVDQPDLAQTFAVTCCLLDIPFLFTGLQSLKIKETDRIEALKVELKKLGYVLYDSQDSILEWNGERCEPESEPVISTYEDHRMAMAFAPASTRISNICIAHPGVVSKSYPNYWNNLKNVGFLIEKED
ncbi:3-phosphoshikimate 1-carboxyvinyltransferase [Dysgonomonas sp. 520]|uniref:3-phosphoshikimate 1-carboxyvinyltransferase n=1 Tax=Dysgonomonas sp. 520 TaxID=2302931 RepID=UPI0013D81A6A|nr:3-phosphoshikimate 1-carboxyvinyltransferase [Dysgonomonas sp. 520]NDW10880.1 3-phosphoshikimate 1-carboxyvinyltransferase [Dysgonomonas sp. 520]